MPSSRLPLWQAVLLALAIGMLIAVALQVTGTGSRYEFEERTCADDPGLCATPGR